MLFSLRSQDQLLNNLLEDRDVDGFLDPDIAGFIYVFLGIQRERADVAHAHDQQFRGQVMFFQWITLGRKVATLKEALNAQCLSSCY